MNTITINYKDVNWGKVSHYLKRLGYDIRGAKDAEEIYRVMTRNFTHPVKDDHYNALIHGTTVKEQPIETKAARYFGLTNNFKTAGYLLRNGNMLDFSGRKHGNLYAYERVEDHRDIKFVFSGKVENIKHGTDAMIYFMNRGNIRMQTNGIDMILPPTIKQWHVIAQHIKHNKDNDYYVDISDSNGNVICGFEYETPLVSTVFADIEKVFKEGC